LKTEKKYNQHVFYQIVILRLTQQYQRCNENSKAYIKTPKYYYC